MYHLPDRFSPTDDLATMRATIRQILASLATLPWLITSGLASADLLQRVTDSGNLRVCIWPDYYGVTFRNPRTQTLSGIDIDNAHDLAQALGVGVTFVNSAFPSLIDDLTSERCDIAMFGIAATSARAAHLHFTPPYLRSDIYAITTRSNRRITQWADIDRPEVVVAVARGTLQESVMRERLQAATLRVVDTPHAREQEVRSGRADVFMTDYPYSRHMLDSNDWARLVSPPTAFQVTPYSWAMKPGEARFHARVEEILAEMKLSGKLRANARRHALEPIVAD